MVDVVPLEMWNIIGQDVRDTGHLIDVFCWRLVCKDFCARTPLAPFVEDAIERDELMPPTIQQDGLDPIYRDAILHGTPAQWSLWPLREEMLELLVFRDDVRLLDRAYTPFPLSHVRKEFAWIRSVPMFLLFKKQGIVYAPFTPERLVWCSFGLFQLVLCDIEEDTRVAILGRLLGYRPRQIVGFELMELDAKVIWLIGQCAPHTMAQGYRFSVSMPWSAAVFFALDKLPLWATSCYGPAAYINLLARGGRAAVERHLAAERPHYITEDIIDWLVANEFAPPYPWSLEVLLEWLPLRWYDGWDNIDFAKRCLGAAALPQWALLGITISAHGVTVDIDRIVTLASRARVWHATPWTTDASWWMSRTLKQQAKLARGYLTSNPPVHELDGWDVTFAPEGDMPLRNYLIAVARKMFTRPAVGLMKRR